MSGISSLGGKLPNSEAVQSALNNIQRAALRIPAKYAVAAAGEMTEEYLQEILTPVFRNLALGENNEFKLFTEDAAYAALLAALSVGVLEGPKIVTTDISMNKAGRTPRTVRGLAWIRVCTPTWAWIALRSKTLQGAQKRPENTV